VNISYDRNVLVISHIKDMGEEIMGVQEEKFKF